jgi:hypothetical protein
MFSSKLLGDGFTQKMPYLSEIHVNLAMLVRMYSENTKPPEGLLKA